MPDGPILHLPTAPAWMTPEQAAAFDRGIEHAAAASDVSATPVDARIDLEHVVSFKCPHHLTADYDPTYRPGVR
jgi:hypothetical protein